MAMINLAAAEDKDFNNWIDNLDLFLLDCDGVLWRGDIGIEGVSKTVDALRARGKRVRFVTNNSTKSRKTYVSKLYETANISCQPEEIISSAYAAAALTTPAHSPWHQREQLSHCTQTPDPSGSSS